MFAICFLQNLEPSLSLIPADSDPDLLMIARTAPHSNSFNPIFSLYFKSDRATAAIQGLRSILPQELPGVCCFCSATEQFVTVDIAKESLLAT